MKISIFIEENYRNTVWCKEILDGVNKKAAALRYETEFVNDLRQQKAITHLLIIGTSPEWADSAAAAAPENIKTVFACCRPRKSGAGYVAADHSEATLEAIDYLNGCGRSKIALYGVNENSFADTLKASCFKKDDIYFSSGSNALADCFSRFETNLARYDAVICTNYISAVSLVRRLKRTVWSVPEKLYVMCFGDSVTGSLINPSLTTVTLDHCQLGKQAVMLCKYTEKQDLDINTSVSLSCRIVPGESTEFKPYRKRDICISKPGGLDIFSADPELLIIQSLEKALRKCSELDTKIISGLIMKKSYGQICDELFISEGTLKYRVKRLLADTGFDSVGKLLAGYREYLDK